MRLLAELRGEGVRGERRVRWLLSNGKLRRGPALRWRRVRLRCDLLQRVLFGQHV
jgi:hypothetical protein